VRGGSGHDAPRAEWATDAGRNTAGQVSAPRNTADVERVEVDDDRERGGVVGRRGNRVDRGRGLPRVDGAAEVTRPGLRV
jgi:hypothetical protein